MITSDDETAKKRLFTAGMLPLFGVIMLACLFVLDRTFELGLDRFGLRPMNARGALGILTAPLIHGSVSHLVDNAIALLVLGWCLVYFYPKAAGRVVAWTWLLGGTLVWLTARHDMHIGASGVLYGMAAFLFFSGVIRKQRTLMAVSLIVVFLYGGLVWGVFPILPAMSWESHFWGGVVGTALAWWLRDVAPAHLPKPIVFEEEAGAPSIVYDIDPGDEDPGSRRSSGTLDPDRTDIA